VRDRSKHGAHAPGGPLSAGSILEHPAARNPGARRDAAHDSMTIPGRAALAAALTCGLFVLALAAPALAQGQDPPADELWREYPLDPARQNPAGEQPPPADSAPPPPPEESPPAAGEADRRAVPADGDGESVQLLVIGLLAAFAVVLAATGVLLVRRRPELVSAPASGAAGLSGLADSGRVAAALTQRLEDERGQQERLEVERRDRERREAEAGERREGEKLERLEADRRASDLLESQQRERERLEAEKRERERLEAALERERLEAEQRERELLEAEKEEHELLAAQHRERERLEAEKRERERREAELERERLEAEGRERELLGAEERERERQEQNHRERERERKRRGVERQEREAVKAGPPHEWKAVQAVAASLEASPELPSPSEHPVSEPLVLPPRRPHLSSVLWFHLRHWSSRLLPYGIAIVVALAVGVLIAYSLGG
jgi:hypothetical protein